ncbi:MAG: serine O-acetyltransferase EpsC [Spirochaetota bacterium]
MAADKHSRRSEHESDVSPNEAAGNGIAAGAPEQESFIERIAQQLSTSEVLSSIYHHGFEQVPMPSTEVLSDISEELRAVLFPGYFGDPGIKDRLLHYHLGAILDNVYHQLSEQVRRGYCFECGHRTTGMCNDCQVQAEDTVQQLIEQLPAIRHLLSTDAIAAYEGDPASQSVGETIFSYPSLHALTNYRIAHVLYKLEVPLIPRIITEIAHSKTGIDIHPGARIDERCFIDHGTGVVIGETSIIGKNVRLYQGVTLGARSFPLDENGKPIKGIDRHPILEDDVIIYSGATLLGRIRIGKGSVIGGNVWLTEDIEPGTTIRANFNH